MSQLDAVASARFDRLQLWRRRASFVALLACMYRRVGRRQAERADARNCGTHSPEFRIKAIRCDGEQKQRPPMPRFATGDDDGRDPRPRRERVGRPRGRGRRRRRPGRAAFSSRSPPQEVYPTVLIGQGVDGIPFTVHPRTGNQTQSSPESGMRSSAEAPGTVGCRPACPATGITCPHTRPAVTAGRATGSYACVARGAPALRRRRSSWTRPPE